MHAAVAAHDWRNTLWAKGLPSRAHLGQLGDGTELRGFVQQGGARLLGGGGLIVAQGEQSGGVEQQQASHLASATPSARR